MGPKAKKQKQDSTSKRQQYSVSFLKEKSERFYVAKEVENLSYPVHRKELIVLSTPSSQYRQRVFGFIFPKDVKETLMSFFLEINKFFLARFFFLFFII